MHHKLYIARRERKMYQKDVAKKLRIDPQTYHLKECGKSDFTLNEAKKLANIFGCTLNDLFADEEVEVIAQ